MYAVGQTAAVMGKVNAAVSPRATQETMAAFQREMEKMNINSEVPSQPIPQHVSRMNCRPLSLSLSLFGLLLNLLILLLLPH
jgi:hypothetical protein